MVRTAYNKPCEYFWSMGNRNCDFITHIAKQKNNSCKTVLEIPFLYTLLPRSKNMQDFACEGNLLFRSNLYDRQYRVGLPCFFIWSFASYTLTKVLSTYQRI